MIKKDDTEQVIKNKSKNFPIVAIGASAGGLEAITHLLQNLQPETGMAFVYIQHLDPSHESKLSTILSRATKMKVLEAKDRIKIEPNKVYIMPPNKDMTILDGTLTLDQRDPKPSVHMPVDKFFCSLAEKKKEASIGIVLSGNASDGTIGLKAIKLAGGITFAQDDTAKFQSMPKTAVAEGVVDMVLAPKDIALQLERIGRYPAIMQEEGAFENEEHFTDANLTGIIQLLKRSTGVDFSHYKMTTIRRRIERRMLLYKMDTLKAYYQYLKQYTNEIPALYQDLLINVTCFFRDTELIDHLKQTVLPEIIKNKNASNPVRIWVPACSSGEEAYSLAMVLTEVQIDLGLNIPVQIFASDLSESAIAKARLGLYSKAELAEVSSKRIQRFFTRVDGSYRISKAIRDLCIFAPHNIFKDPPFSRMDLISCCNLLIYLDNFLQKKVIGTLHYALNKNGYLVLGKSETIGASTSLFSQAEKKFRLYVRKNEGSTRAVFEMHHHLPDVERTTNNLVKPVPQKETVKGGDLEKTVDNILLNQYVPASVVVNQDLDILQFRGATRLFLEPSAGKASLNILKMVRPSLALELRGAFHKVNKTNERIKKTGLQFIENSFVHKVSIEIIPLQSISDEKFFLVVFDEISAPVKEEDKALLTKDKLVKQLRDELSGLKEDMRSIMEGQEANVEELQSANEEIVSSNEELQSINEELETSKEELESTNEELMTINNELLVRNEQLAESYEYAEAVFETIREAVILLDKDFRVKTANKAFYRIFNTNEEETEGMLLFELGNRQWNNLKLRELLEHIIPQNNFFHGFLVHHHFPIIGEKYMMLNARRITQRVHRQELILLAIEDITEHKQAQKIISEREEWFRTMADNAPVLIWVADINQTKNFFNQTWLEYTGKDLEELVLNGWQKLIHEDDFSFYTEKYNAGFSAKQSYNVEYRLRRVDGEYRWIVEQAKPTFNDKKEFNGFIGSCTEIHDRRLMNEELEKHVIERTHELDETNKALKLINEELEQYAYAASHDLQEPLRKIVTFSDRLLNYKEEVPETGKKYIDKIISSAQKMSRLIDDILNFSKISKTDHEFKRVDLNKVMTDVLTDFELIITQKNAVVTYKKMPEIEGLPLQLEQLFHNLLSNALKFAKDDVPPVVEISSQKLSPAELDDDMQLVPGKDYVNIKVRDNGIGIDDMYKDQIFGLFQRLNERQKFPGSGIGLALCKKIVIAHGGDIKVLSKKDEGTEFQIILPISQNHVPLTEG
jgi:two-component system CheB/CheR fusion protein